MSLIYLPIHDKTVTLTSVTEVRFKGVYYKVIFTEHSKLQMSLRELTESEVLDVIQTGKIKPKDIPGKFWVYNELRNRKDNFISVSISIEKPHLIVITTMINWRPQ